MPKVNPHIFPLEYKHNGHFIFMKDNNEAICQGGPIVSKLFIGESKVGKEAVFGGPILFHKNWILAPKLIRKVLRGHGFQLLGIELNTLETVSLISFEIMILLHEIKDGKIYFFKDKENSTLESIEMPLELQ